MTRTPILLPLALLGIASAVSCGKGATKKSAEPQVEGCPSQVEEVARLDWGLDETNEGPIVAGVLATIETELLLTALEVELTDACGELATHLFAREKDLEPENFQMGMTAQKACSVASQNVDQLAQRAGGEVTISVGRRRCKTPMDAAASCLAACGEPAQVQCAGELQGRCAGVCTGVCASSDQGDCAGRCDGACEGSCDSAFDGTCRGNCEGMCDGEPSKGACGGVCMGRCLEGASGTCGGACKGECQGACRVDAEGECEGTCEGVCDKLFEDAACVGATSLPQGASLCQRNCEAALLHSLACDPPDVKVAVENPTDQDAAEQLARTLSAYLPGVLAATALNVEVDRLLAFGEGTKSRIDGMKSAVQASAKDEKSKLTDGARSCISEKVTMHIAHLAGLPLILAAADDASDIVPSELD